MKVVVNRCFGGFGLSHEGVMHYAELKGIKVYAYHVRSHDIGSYEDFRGRYDQRLLEPGPNELFTHYSTSPDLKISKDLTNDNYFDPSDIQRDDPALVQTVEDLGEKANGRCAELEVVEIPDGVEWSIEEYDGNEHVSEVHRTW